MSRLLRAIPFTLVLLTACNFFIPREPAVNPDPNHIHMDLAVWIEGRQVDFTNAKYMSGVSTDETSHDEEDEYHHKYLHLHDGIGHVIHSHTPGLTLGEFLSSLGFRMSEECMDLDTGIAVCPQRGYRWRMFVNGIEQPMEPNHVFGDLEKILLTYQGSDPVSELRIKEQLKEMTDDACLYSRTCPERGDPPAENCLADPEVPCVAPVE